MAESLKSVFKPVQELAVDRNTLPERYIYKSSDEAIDVNISVIDIQIIDLNSLKYSSPSADKELEKLRTSLSSCGCFQVCDVALTNQKHSVCLDFNESGVF